MTPQEVRIARRAIAKAAMQHEDADTAARLERIGCPGILFEFAGSTEMESHCANLAARATDDENGRDMLTSHMIKHCRMIEALDASV